MFLKINRRSAVPVLTNGCPPYGFKYFVDLWSLPAAIPQARTSSARRVPFLEVQQKEAGEFPVSVRDYD
jgi:hypothetical protein